MACHSLFYSHNNIWKLLHIIINHRLTLSQHLPKWKVFIFVVVSGFRFKFRICLGILVHLLLVDRCRHGRYKSQFHILSPMIYKSNEKNGFNLYSNRICVLEYRRRWHFWLSIFPIVVHVHSPTLPTSEIFYFQNTLNFNLVELSLFRLPCKIANNK